MVLNNTFKTIQNKTTQLGNNKTSNFHIKDFWEEESEKHPSKNECLFYCE